MQKWFDVQDMVVEEALPPVIVLSEAFIQVYELQDEKPATDAMDLA